MANSNEIGNSGEKLELLCDSCQKECEIIAAVSFCEECNEYLCKQCNKYHSRLAASRDHAVQEGNDLPGKSSFESSKNGIPAKCFVHGSERVSHYCIPHEKFCCSICLSMRHHNCKDVLHTDDDLSDGTIQEEENDLKSNMHELTEEVKKNMYLFQQSPKAIAHHYDVAHSSMLRAKNATIKCIEDSYTNLDKELCKIREGNLNMILLNKTKCDETAYELKSIKTYLKERKKCGRHQMKSAMRNASIKLKSKRQELQKMKSSLHLNVKPYDFQPHKHISKLTSAPSSFGQLNVSHNPEKAAHPVYSLNVHCKDDVFTCCIVSLVLVSQTLLVLVDCKNKSVKLVETEQDKILSKVILESAPMDATVLPEKQIAVSIPDCKTVEFLSVSENTILEKLQSKQIKLGGKGYGLTYANNKIIVIVYNYRNQARFEWYDLDGRLSLSVAADANNPRYIASNADGEKIYTSDIARNSKIIERSSVDAKILNKLHIFRDEVMGIAVDKQGGLYYLCNSCSHRVDYVYVDEKNKTHWKHVFLIGNINQQSKCLTFCNETSRLFVGKNGNDIEVYIVI